MDMEWLKDLTTVLVASLTAFVGVYFYLRSRLTAQKKEDLVVRAEENKVKEAEETLAVNRMKEISDWMSTLFKRRIKEYEDKVKVLETEMERSKEVHRECEEHRKRQDEKMQSLQEENDKCRERFDQLTSEFRAMVNEIHQLKDKLGYSGT